MKKDSTTGRLLNEVSEQLTFENLVTEEKETPEIISTLPGEFQPRKAEELLPDIDILRDTYIIYPDGGYHPFYRVPNTPPRYQQKIWPFVKRIKFHKRFKNLKKLTNLRKNNLSTNQTPSQINPTMLLGYPRLTLRRTEKGLVNYYTNIKKNGQYRRIPTERSYQTFLHRLIALAWIPNPENKPMVLHINDDPTNYLIENLKWGTGGENQKGKIQKHPDTMKQKYLNLVDKGFIKG